MVERRRFAAMGSTAEIIVVGGSDRRAVEAAVVRVGELEQRWSRFVDTSEVTMVNRGAGEPVTVSEDTVLLVELACEAWERTGGRFDPTVLRAVEAIGYTASLDRASPGLGIPPSVGTVPAAAAGVGGCGSIVVDRATRTVRLPPGVGFDPGGIGKGLAADLVGFELRAAGVAGGCVNIGGDIRVWGRGPNGPRWRVGSGGRTFDVTDVGVATSGVERRAWIVDGEPVHHVIDPSTARPARSGPVAVTVVAGSAWRAETCATALLVAKPDEIAVEAERLGVEALPA